MNHGDMDQYNNKRSGCRNNKKGNRNKGVVGPSSLEKDQISCPTCFWFIRPFFCKTSTHVSKLGLSTKRGIFSNQSIKGWLGGSKKVLSPPKNWDLHWEEKHKEIWKIIVRATAILNVYRTIILFVYFSLIFHPILLFPEIRPPNTHIKYDRQTTELTLNMCSKSVSKYNQTYFPGKHNECFNNHQNPS